MFRFKSRAQSNNIECKPNVPFFSRFHFGFVPEQTKNESYSFAISNNCDENNKLLVGAIATHAQKNDGVMMGGMITNADTNNGTMLGTCISTSDFNYGHLLNLIHCDVKYNMGLVASAYSIIYGSSHKSRVASIFSYFKNKSSGFTFSLFFSYAKKLKRSLRISLFANLCKEASRSREFSLFFNYAKKLKTSRRFSLVNVCREASGGFDIGLFNICSGAQWYAKVVPFFSIHKKKNLPIEISERISTKTGYVSKPNPSYTNLELEIPA